MRTLRFACHDTDSTCRPTLETNEHFLHYGPFPLVDIIQYCVVPCSQKDSGMCVIRRDRKSLRRETPSCSQPLPAAEARLQRVGFSTRHRSLVQLCAQLAYASVSHLKMSICPQTADCYGTAVLLSCAIRGLHARMHAGYKRKVHVFSLLHIADDEAEFGPQPGSLGGGVV